MAGPSVPSLSHAVMPASARRVGQLLVHLSSPQPTATPWPAQAAPAAAAGGVPIVDVSAFLTHRASASASAASDDDDAAAAAAQGVVDAVAAACVSHSFVVVTGHGVDPSLAAACASAASSFFAQPESVKQLVAAKGGAFGFIPLNSEALGDGGDATARPDLREAFAMGPVANLRPDIDGADLTAHDRELLDFCYQPTPWPASVPTLRTAMEVRHVVPENGRCIA